MTEEALPLFEPKDAIAFFRGKGLKFGFSWLDVFKAEHDRAFTVAKAMTRDLLEDIRAAMDAAIAEGQTLAMFRKNLRPVLEAKGWWGVKTMVDPLTGQREAAQLGSPRRLKTIYETNMRTAYAGGRWARIERNKAAFPLLRYICTLDGRERDEHRAWHNTLLPVDHPWWATHYPPCDWGCRCKALPMNARMAAKKGLAETTSPIAFRNRLWRNKRTGEVESIERGIGAGWNYHVGKEGLGGIVPDPLPPGAVTAAARETASDALLKPLGIPLQGGVFTDKAGWPLAIGPAMARGRHAPSRAALRAAAKAISRPESIRWAWVTDDSGAATLMRRYIVGPIAVDIGRAGWRIGRNTARLGGTVVWARETAEALGYDPRQPRDKRGRFASSGSPGAIAASLLASAERSRHSIGSVDVATSKATEHAFGVKTEGWSRSIESSGVLHVDRAHGARSRFAGTSDEIKPHHYDLIPRLVHGSVKSPMGNLTGKKGARIRHEALIDGRRMVYVEQLEPRKKRLSLKTLFFVTNAPREPRTRARKKRG